MEFIYYQADQFCLLLITPIGLIILYLRSPIAPIISPIFQNNLAIKFLAIILLPIAITC